MHEYEQSTHSRQDEPFEGVEKTDNVFVSPVHAEIVISSSDGPLRTTDQISKPKGIWDASLRPEELLNRNAKAGKFSLQHVLSTEDDGDVLDDPSKDNESLPDDPVQCKILTFHVAMGLFDNFMRSLNPFICHFDPQLHTLEYVRHKSSFLFTSILAAASKAFHPPLHADLRTHSEALLAKTFIKGEKSVEIVQAILVRTYWKDPEDTRSFLLVGHAIRMCHEMGWHTLKYNPPELPATAMEIRESRNILRTWLILFVYDRRYVLHYLSPSRRSIHSIPMEC